MAPGARSNEVDNGHDSVVGAGGLQVLPRLAVPEVYHEPYIMDGYRRCNCSYVDCLRYAFVLHNDCGNFWTHFLPLFIWLPWLYSLSLRLDLTDPYFYPLLCFWAGSCSYAFFSSVAHLLGNKSFTVVTVCFILDYQGIAMYAFGCGMAMFFYEQTTTSTWYQYQWPVLIAEAALAINAVILCALSRFFFLKQRFIVRAVAFLLPYIADLVPFIQRFTVCITLGQDCIYETLHLHLISIVAALVIIFFFVTKIPERFAPGRFDYLGQSHQLFHLSTVVLTTAQMKMIPTDALAHREILSALPDYHPNLSSTFLLYALVQVCVLVCVGVFGLLVSRRVLISNKREVVTDLLKREKLN